MEKIERLLVSENSNYIELKNINEIKNNNLLLNISSKYVLKNIFLYLNYECILKLIRYNKHIQNRIGINKKNYNNYSNTRYYIREEFGIYEKFSLLIFASFDSIFIMFCLGYKEIFQEGITTDNIFLNTINIILNILSIIISITLMISRIFESPKNILVLLSIITVLLCNILILIILISILVLIGFYIIDFLYLLINLAFIAYFFYLIFIKLKSKITYYLIKYKNIPIQEYYLEDFKEKEKLKYISKIVYYLKYNYSTKDLKIFNEINYFREKNNLEELDLDLYLPEFIINEISDIFLYDSQKLFKLKGDKYLFKYKVGEFENYLKNNDKDLIDILLKSYLENINIIVQDDIQYILIY